jgi:hypothetical protein
LAIGNRQSANGFGLEVGKIDNRKVANRNWQLAIANRQMVSGWRSGKLITAKLPIEIGNWQSPIGKWFRAGGREN